MARFVLSARYHSSSESEQAEIQADLLTQEPIIAVVTGKKTFPESQNIRIEYLSPLVLVAKFDVHPLVDMHTYKQCLELYPGNEIIITNDSDGKIIEVEKDSEEPSLEMLDWIVSVALQTDFVVD